VLVIQQNIKATKQKFFLLAPLYTTNNRALQQPRISVSASANKVNLGQT